MSIDKYVDEEIDLAIMYNEEFKFIKEQCKLTGVVYNTKLIDQILDRYNYFKKSVGVNQAKKLVFKHLYYDLREQSDNYD